jgi:predicted DNA-binding protein with PD1-like motif
MDWGIVVAALITAVGGVMTTLMMVMRKENTEDHAKVVDALEVLSGNVTTIGTKLDGHIDWHLKGTTNGETIAGNKSAKPKRNLKAR